MLCSVFHEAPQSSLVGGVGSACAAAPLGASGGRRWNRRRDATGVALADSGTGVGAATTVGVSLTGSPATVGVSPAVTAVTSSA